MKFRGHETFFIRKGWLSKGMKYIQQDPAVFVSRERNPMDVLGIGANMVKSLRYWMTTVGLTKEAVKGKRVQELTETGRLIYENDRYIEEFGTLCILQHHLASQKESATAWYYFFNVFNLQEFTKDDFVNGLHEYTALHDEKVALRSLGDDFTCILGTYLPRYKTRKQVSPEDNIDCPLGELGLIDIVDREKKRYKKSCPPASRIHPWVAASFIMEQAGERNEIALNDLLVGENSIGKLFNFDVITLIDVLRRVEKTGAVKIIRTAGLDVLRVNEHIEPAECIKRYYEDLGA